MTHEGDWIQPVEQPAGQRGRRGLSALWKVLLAICAAPIALPLILAAAAFILVVIFTVCALVLAVAACGVGAIGAGIAAAWAGFQALFGAGLATTMFLCGVGMLSSGVGLLIVSGSFALAGLCFKGVAGAMGRWLARKEAGV